MTHQAEAELPKYSGSESHTKYVMGFNPKKQRAFSHELGVKGFAPRKPAKMGLHSLTAPHKTETQHFDTKFGFPGGFGDTGLTGES